MFTLKLQAWPRTRIIECESVTIYCYDHGTSYQITAHQRDGNDRAFYAGDDNVPKTYLSDEWFERVIIENAAGKTTQIIQPLPSENSATVPSPSNNQKLAA